MKKSLELAFLVVSIFILLVGCSSNFEEEMARAHGAVLNGDFDAALAAYQAIETEETNQEAAKVQKVIELDNAALMLIGKKEYDQAIQKYNEILELDDIQQIEGHIFAAKKGQEIINLITKAVDPAPINNKQEQVITALDELANLLNTYEPASEYIRTGYSSKDEVVEELLASLFKIKDYEHAINFLVYYGGQKSTETEVWKYISAIEEMNEGDREQAEFLLDQIETSYTGMFAKEILEYKATIIPRSEWESRRHEREEIEAYRSMPQLPSVGMTSEEVQTRTRLGELTPEINRTTTAYGVSEQWVYSNGIYLYFEDGILTTINE